jgi:hypothetical protein
VPVTVPAQSLKSLVLTPLSQHYKLGTNFASTRRPVDAMTQLHLRNVPQYTGRRWLDDGVNNTGRAVEEGVSRQLGEGRRLRRGLPHSPLRHSIGAPELRQEAAVTVATAATSGQEKIVLGRSRLLRCTASLPQSVKASWKCVPGAEMAARGAQGSVSGFVVGSHGNVANFSVEAAALLGPPLEERMRLKVPGFSRERTSSALKHPGVEAAAQVAVSLACQSRLIYEALGPTSGLVAAQPRRHRHAPPVGQNSEEEAWVAGVVHGVAGSGRTELGRKLVSRTDSIASRQVELRQTLMLLPQADRDCQQDSLCPTGEEAERRAESLEVPASGRRRGIGRRSRWSTSPGASETASTEAASGAGASTQQMGGATWASSGVWPSPGSTRPPTGGAFAARESRMHRV